MRPPYHPISKGREEEEQKRWNEYTVGKEENVGLEKLLIQDLTVVIPLQKNTEP